MSKELRENLAELAHSQWSGWMDYLFSKCVEYKPDSVQAFEGALIIPQWAVDRWKKQAKTPYSELTPAEMDSDRTEADKFLAVFATRQPDKELVEAYGYASRLFKTLAPQCEPHDSLVGVLTQIDNWCSKPHKQNKKLVDALEAINNYVTSPCALCEQIDEEKCNCVQVEKYIKAVGLFEQALSKAKEQR